MIFHNLCFLSLWNNYYTTPNNFQISYFPDQANNDDKDVPGFILCGYGKDNGVAIYIRYCYHIHVEISHAALYFNMYLIVVCEASANHDFALWRQYPAGNEQDHPVCL